MNKNCPLDKNEKKDLKIGITLVKVFIHPKDVYIPLG
jgi:hypothetical protein